MRDRALVICLIFCLHRLSGRALLVPSLADSLFLLPVLCLVHLSRYMPCVCVSPPRGFSSPTLFQPHLSLPPACRICRLLALAQLQTARFPRRYPETEKNSTTSGMSLKPINNNLVCSLGHKRRPYPTPLLCRWLLVSVLSPAQPASVGRRPGTGCVSETTLFGF